MNIKNLGKLKRLATLLEARDIVACAVFTCILTTITALAVVL